jgi:hypothetical protein
MVVGMLLVGPTMNVSVQNVEALELFQTIKGMTTKT